MEGSRNFYHMGLNISPLSKCSHGGRDSIPRPLEQQPSAIATRSLWRGWFDFLCRACPISHFPWTQLLSGGCSTSLFNYCTYMTVSWPTFVEIWSPKFGGKGSTYDQNRNYTAGVCVCFFFLLTCDCLGVSTYIRVYLKSCNMVFPLSES